MKKKHLIIGSADLCPDFTTRTGKLFLGPMAKYVLRATGKDRPKFCYIGTAAGDDAFWISRFYDLCKNQDVEPSHLQLFKMPNHKDIKKHLLSQDAIWIAGGSTANLIAVWKVHGIFPILREAWERGIVLSGYSAGCMCFSASGTTDSFGVEPQLIINNESFLPFSHCVHNDNEPLRRPMYNGLVESGQIPEGYATDEGAAIHFLDKKPYKFISDRSGASAYHVYRAKDGKVIEDMIEPELLPV